MRGHKSKLAPQQGIVLGRESTLSSFCPESYRDEDDIGGLIPYASTWEHIILISVPYIKKTIPATIH